MYTADQVRQAIATLPENQGISHRRHVRVDGTPALLISSERYANGAGRGDVQRVQDACPDSEIVEKASGYLGTMACSRAFGLCAATAQ